MSKSFLGHFLLVYYIFYACYFVCPFLTEQTAKKCSITFSVLATTIIIVKCYKILQNICLYDDHNASENACLRCVVWHDAGRRVDVYIRIFSIYKYIKWKNKYFLLIFRYIGLVHIAKKKVENVETFY